MLSRRGEASQRNAFELTGPRVVLRALVPDDFEQWRDVRVSSGEWLTKWEPASAVPDIANDRRAFNNRCGMRDREWQLGLGYGFGIFVGSAGRVFAGEINVSSVQRGPFQNAYVGYWIDRAQAGQGYMPESLVLIMQFAFEEIGLHRLQISIVPRNAASRRVVEKLGLRDEGTALRYLEINGVWEDHVRYGVTFEDWLERRDEFYENWLSFS